MAKDHHTKHLLAGIRRLVIKVGSSLVCDDDGAPRLPFISSLVADVARLRAQGYEIAIVSSGAVALGSVLYGVMRPQMLVEQQQAAAAVGQIRLMRLWRETLEAHDITCAQILLTWDDMERLPLGARATMRHLWQAGAIPIINENDSIATDEIIFGDNDRLAALVAKVAMADGLLLLSDVDGLYEQDPRHHPQARHIEVVRYVISEDIKQMAGTAAAFGSGGMVTKLQAASVAMAAGCHMVIADGRHDDVMSRLWQGKTRCTFFVAQHSPHEARQLWLKKQTPVTAQLVLDERFLSALHEGESLQAQYIHDVRGAFSRGDVVSLMCGGDVIGKGIVAWDAAQWHKKKDDTSEVLPYDDTHLVDRDDLWLVSS